MTNSMIPHSFVPGTKAKAGEVNENFISLANYIEQNKSSATSDIEELREVVDTKADKTELITDHTVTNSNTNLNTYKTKGTYIFTSAYTPENIPSGTAGMLVVTGDIDSCIKQIWFCEGTNAQIYTRNFIDSVWTAWASLNGNFKRSLNGYLKIANNMIFQWGTTTSTSVTYPIAFPSVASPVFMKNGFGVSHERSDTGFTSNSLTGFSIATGGICNCIYWVAIGY